MENSSEKTKKKEELLIYRAKAAAFLTLAGGIGLFGGFAGALASIKKSDPSGFDQGLVGQGQTISPGAKARLLNESGAALATKALGYGTLLAFGGCGLLFWSGWKLSGAQDFQEFRQKVGNILPSIPKKPPVGRTEFSGLNDLLQYIIDRDKEEQAAKKRDGKSS